TISALWILVANAWMQYPVGMKFNPDSVRNEMVSFLDVLLSPVAINKFLHTVISSWVLGSVFVIAISCWFLLKNRNSLLALKSIRIASIFGFFALLVTIVTGDDTAKVVARVQPMKLAAMEGLYDGSTNQSIVAFGILNPEKRYNNDEKEFLFAIRLPDVLSYLAYGKTDAFVPGINDILKGGYEQKGIKDDHYIMPPIAERIESGQEALEALASYRQAKEEGNMPVAELNKKILEKNYPNFGYGYVRDVEQVIPSVPFVFYAFHAMVLLGAYFLLFFPVVYFLLGRKNPNTTKFRWLYWVALLSLPLAYIMSEAGWVTAEMGRQPWTIQDILPTFASISRLSPGTVATTFWMFLVLFTALLIADIWIIVRQVKKEKFDEAFKSENY
ncbi:MAG: cytochrome ubiquinol oxidase subunit I, partial [Bacteroidales bacterium]